MKQSEIKPCALCKKPVMHCGNTFLRITATYCLIDTRMIGDLEISRAADLFVCNDCAVRRPILDLIENAVPTDERFREEPST